MEEKTYGTESMKLSLMEEAASQPCCMGFEATEPSDLGEEVREG